MNLDLSDDQRMLRDSLTRLIADRQQGTTPVMWGELVDLGLTMLPFAEDRGGLGLGGVETMLVGAAFGRALVSEPYLASVVLAGTALACAERRARADAWLGGIMAGETLAALADTASVNAEADVDGVRLTGSATTVLGGDVADVLLVAASGRLFAVPIHTPGVYCRSYRLHGGGGAADVAFDHVRIDAEALLGDATGPVTRAIEAGIAFLAAETSGAMQAALDLTVEYLKTREQFGKPIGFNQALQHRAAEMLVETEQARSAALYAAMLSGEDDVAERARGFAAVKAVIGKAARFVAQNAVQLHGGIGISEEHAISHYFRRLTAIGMLLGDSETHLERLAALGGFTAPAYYGEA